MARAETALLRLPGFPRFACSAMLNTVAFAGEQVVLGWLVLDLTNSPLWVGVALALRMAPLLVVGLPAGVLADRGDRLVLLRGANTTMALALTAVGTLAVLGRATIGLVLALTVRHRLRARPAAGDAAGPRPRPGRRRATDRGARGPRHRDAHRRSHGLAPRGPPDRRPGTGRRVPGGRIRVAPGDPDPPPALLARGAPAHHIWLGVGRPVRLRRSRPAGAAPAAAHGADGRRRGPRLLAPGRPAEPRSRHPAGGTGGTRRDERHAPGGRDHRHARRRAA